MITDAPYEAEDLVLTPAWGALAGVGGAFVMLLLAALVGSSESMLLAVGRAVLPEAWVQPGWQGWLLGLGVHLTGGAVLGLLHASSQRRAPTPAVVLTGVAFGVMIWVGARIVTSVAFGGLRELLHSWFWFFSCLLFGITVAGAAALRQRVRPARPVVVLKD
jgi:hypothetical protein